MNLPWDCVTPQVTGCRVQARIFSERNRCRLSGRSARRKAKRARPTLGWWTFQRLLRTLQGALEVTVAITKLCCVIVANSRVTCRAANDTRFIEGEAETL